MLSNSKSKINKLDYIISSKHDIFWFDITVQYSTVMTSFQTHGYLAYEIKHLVFRKVYITTLKIADVTSKINAITATDILPLLL